MIELGLILATIGVTFGVTYRQARRSWDVVEGFFRQRIIAAETPFDYEPTPYTGLAYFGAVPNVLDGLRDAKFTELGEVRVVAPAVSKPTIGRLYVDETHTRFAWLVTNPEENAGVQVSINSFADDRVTTTTRMSTQRNFVAGMLATPDNLDRIFVPSSMSMAETLAHHKPIAPMSRLLRASTLDEILALMRKQNEHVVAWRKAQPRDELLDADVRAFLGPKLEKRISKFKQRLTAPPKATARGTRGRREES